MKDTDSYIVTALQENYLTVRRLQHSSICTSGIDIEDVDIDIDVDIEDTYVTLLAMILLIINNVFCNQLLLHINTWYWTIDYNQYSETKYSNSKNCYLFQH